MTAFQYGDAHPEAARFHERLSRVPLNRALRCVRVLAQVQELLYRDPEGYRTAVGLFNAHLTHIRGRGKWAVERPRRDKTAGQVCRVLATAAADLLVQHLTASEQIEWFETALEVSRQEGDAK